MEWHDFCKFVEEREKPMTEEEKINRTASEIRQLVKESRLKEALDKLQVQMSGVTDWQLVSRTDDLVSQYGYMLRYFSEGVQDDARHSLYSKLLSQTILLNDEVLRARLIPCSMKLQYQYLRSNAAHGISVAGLRVALEESAVSPEAHEKALSNLFDSIWTSALWTTQDAAEWSELCESPLVLSADAAFVCSAVTIALNERFDPQKMLFLCHHAGSNDKQVSMRAITGLAMAVVRYSEMLPYFPQVESGISMLTDKRDICERLAAVQVALLLCRQTTMIDRRMREEIIPSMLSNHKLGDLMIDVIDSDGESPEWRDTGKSKIRDSLMEMTELQMEGADVYMSTFSNLKNYPFFHKVCNWFRVFSLDQPDVKASLGDSGIEKSVIGKSMLLSGTFCNSDKYSFALTFSQIPKEQRDMIAAQLDGQLSDELEDALARPQSNASLSEKQIIRQYTQDLYRFFNLFSRRHEFSNPFELNLNLLENSYLSPILKSSDSSYDIAVWLLEKNYFQEAANAFMRMEADADNHSTDYRFYQQMGYALQRSGQYGQAYEAYIRADLLQSDNAWNLRHMAQCQRITGNPEKALELLLDAEKLQKDNISLQIQIGDCLVDMQRYDDALARFFKVDYLKPEYSKAWRAIGWCAFLAGKYEKANDYYDRLLATEPDGVDLMNAAHARWTSGNTGRAVELYRKSVEKLGQERFVQEFDKDRPTLVLKGISEADFPIMLDCICQI